MPVEPLSGLFGRWKRRKEYLMGGSFIVGVNVDLEGKKKETF